MGNLFYNTNGQNFVVKRIETSLVARPVTGITLQDAASWNHSRQTNSPALIDNNPMSVNYGQPITQICTSTPCTAVTNPFGPESAPSADAPPRSLACARVTTRTARAHTGTSSSSSSRSGPSLTLDRPERGRAVRL